VRRLLRGTLRIVVGLGAAAGLAALARAALDRRAGEPGGSDGHGPGTNGSNGQRRTPMSFDRWPAVPPAPGRSEA
jgi:hypothetical protein